MMRCGNVEIRSVDFHISTRRRRASHGCAWGHGAMPGRPSIRAPCRAGLRRRSMQYAGCIAIFVTMVSATLAQNTLTPLLVARARASVTPRRASPRQTPIDRATAQTESDSGDTPRPPPRPVSRDGRRAGRPTSQRATRFTAPTLPGGLDEQTAQLARARFRNVPTMAALRRTVSRGTNPIAAPT